MPNLKDQDKWAGEKAREFLEKLIGYDSSSTLREFETSCELGEIVKEVKDFILSIVKELKPVVDKSWLPTAENINALPDPIRRYIHDLETNADPAGMVQENIILKENCKALEMMKKPKVKDDVEVIQNDAQNSNNAK